MNFLRNLEPNTQLNSDSINESTVRAPLIAAEQNVEQNTKKGKWFQCLGTVR